MSQVEQAVSEITGRAVTRVRRLGGTACAVQLDDGRTVFAKSAEPSSVAAEAASLEWLADAGAVPVPAVHGHDDRVLVTDHITAGRPSPRAADELGRGLAALHAAGAPAFGAPPPGGPADAWIGLAPMRNEHTDTWPEFYARLRVEPYVRLARDAGDLSTAEAKIITDRCERLDEVPAEPPARLHGDLWSGNVHWADRAWLIDPAAHGGHRETDLAMLHLFGCPHLERVLAAYQEVSPLAAGWQDRIGLHQLFPLLVHAVLFGRGYAVQAVAAARG
ncbi:fructosamine kinase family protein [Saccharopolyspora taberi]|uniref:Fructosamine kinase family protein n=1 Tax=Saccharopolyspora taberi TaxID=60895 RepID=A0ABN3V3V1_9PSEU